MTSRSRRNTSHAEGGHGPKTEVQIRRQLHASPPELPVAERIERDRERAAREGKRRLVEGREQHDERAKNSERNRSRR